jgi:C1A family cysteine protease
MWLFYGNQAKVTTRKYGWDHTEQSLPESEMPYKVMRYHPNLESVSEVDLDKKFHVDIYDQGQLGSCTSNGWVYCYEYEMLKQGESYLPMSRLMHYYCERKDKENDTGAQIKDGAKVLTEEGMTLESLWPYDISKFSEKPPQNCWDDMQYHKGVKVERVKKTTKDIIQCLLDGTPVVFGFMVYDSFEKVSKENPYVPIPDTKKESLLGGHCVVINSYFVKDGKKWFGIRNSWGPNWADNGRCYMSEDFLMHNVGVLGMQELCSDFWTVKLVKDEQDPNVPVTESQKLEHIKRLLGIESVENNLVNLYDGIRKLVVNVEFKKPKSS